MAENIYNDEEVESGAAGASTAGTSAEMLEN